MVSSNLSPAVPASTIGTAQHFRWLEGIVKATLLLNGIDAVLTLIWIQTGLATEANPVMADLVHHHPVTFVLAKVALVSLGSGLLWRLRTRPLAVIGIFAVFLAYYFLILYHLDYANGLVRALLSGASLQFDS
ncbi:MAG: DUF5658 family protein [Myxococcota bacterium]